MGLGLGAVAMAAYALRKLRNRLDPLPDPDSAKDSATEREVGSSQPAGPRGLQVGDVLLYADSELWLAGKIELDEEGFVLRLFRTPGAGRCDWVVQLDAEARDLAMAQDTLEEVPDGRVPESLPIGGFRLSLRRRGQAQIVTQGDSLPPVTERCEYVELGGPGGRGLLVLDFRGGGRIALVMERMGRELFDLLPGGD